MSTSAIQLTLPDGSVREYAAGTTGLAVAESIGKGLAKAAVGIELDGQPLKTGDMQFRVTPSQGEPVDVVATIHSGRAENNVAKDVRDAFAAKLSPQRYTVEVDDGEDILVKKKEGQPDFALELVEANVQNVSIKVEGE